jgi:hypothetical protein
MSNELEIEHLPALTRNSSLRNETGDPLVAGDGSYKETPGYFVPVL